MSAPRAPAVALEGVGKRFGDGTTAVDALTEIALTVAAGEFVSLIGPSGCGKSTLLRIIANLIDPTEGSVSVNGKSARRARLDQDYGIAFQQAGLLEWRTVQANVELPLALHGVAREERRKQARELLELVGLSEFGAHRPSQLSGGMQQRVAIEPRSMRGLAVDEDLPCRRRDEVADDAQERRLATARGPDQRDELAPPDLEVDLLERGHAAFAEGLRHALGGDDEVAHTSTSGARRTTSFSTSSTTRKKLIPSRAAIRLVAQRFSGFRT